MIIVLTGAGGTGKTTLAELLAERYGLPFLPSPAREVQLEYGIDLEDEQALMPPSMLAEMQARITECYWAGAVAAGKDGAGYVADRSIADPFCYRMLRAGADMTKAEMNLYFSRVEEQLIAATLVVQCPTGLFDPPSDGMRTEDPVQRELFDVLNRGVVDRFRNRINVLPLNIADRDNRMLHIHRALLNTGELPPIDASEAMLIRGIKPKEIH